MKTIKTTVFALVAAVISFSVITSCSEDGTDGINGKDGVNGKDGNDGTDGLSTNIFSKYKPTKGMFMNKSVQDPLVTVSGNFSSTKVFSLISTPDRVNNSFSLAGSADGAGFLKDGENFIYVVNCEDSYAVARMRIDKNLNVISGDYLLNSGVSDFARQCSGTMWEKEIHGGNKDLFLSASESISYDVKGIDPRVSTPTPQADFGLDALGEFSWENAVPLPKNAYAGKTVIIGGDDDSSGSQGQVAMYYSENGDADLENGKIYVLRFKQVSDGSKGIKAVNSGETYNEGQLDFGGTYDVEFVEIVNGKDKTKSEMEDACVAVNASQFMRVEDVDYQKGSDANGRNVFFAVTGRGPSRGTYNDWGTVYKLELDASNPLEGKLTQIISGNTDTNNKDGNLSELQSPDNICVTENFVYVQEDPNSFDRGHGARIYQSDLSGNNAKTVMEINNSRSGEYGSLIDISDKIGVPNTFLLAVQPHFWRNDAYVNLDGHNNITYYEDNQASQILIVKGLPR